MKIGCLLKKRDTIYGVCTIWIVLFHIFRKISMPYIPLITNIIGIGNVAVDVFFFMSGVCLSLSAQRRKYASFGWRDYYKRRIIRIAIPYFLIAIPYYFWAALHETGGGFLRKTLYFFGNLSSISFWLKGTQTTWYVYGIAVFYLLFPVIYNYFIRNDQKKGKWVILILSQILFAIISSYVPILKNSMILWARLPIFTLGIIAGIFHTDSQNLKPQRRTVIISIILIFFLGAVTSISELSNDFTIPQVYRFLIYIPMTLALLSILSVDDKRIKGFEKVGALSLEIYLIHITLLHPLKYYGIIDSINHWLYLILPTVSILLALLVKQIEQKIKFKKVHF